MGVNLIKKDKVFKIDSFLIVMILFFAALLFVGFWTIFKDDFFAIHYGRLMHWIPVDKVSVESTTHGKIAIYALFCVSPIAILKIASCFNAERIVFPKVLLIITAVLAFIGLIVLYYFLTKDLYSLIPHAEHKDFDFGGGFFGGLIAIIAEFVYPFMAEFGGVYIWYTAPFFFDTIAIVTTAVLLKIRIREWIKTLLFTLIVLPLLILTPFLIILTGAVIGLIVGLIVVAIVVIVGIAVISNAAEPDGHAVDSEGREYTRYGNTYIDSSGNSYTSYDGGNTIER